ncbi:YafY family transcriptional regulator [Sphaerisporangium album]|uniref:YafY family transcriptional regulator n=1 Tax=Sphaerisporangium album TaxID=509200 RepID=A0A367F4Z6_9ACTN|nr:YafY family protein [Sphaerisporangium album]RCG25446.1 YafY family transcriptional regulator [Sphaerisporangium album]
MNRTDRLYALVEELRAISPRCRSARELGDRLRVSARTIERDIATLQRAGVPIHAEPGKRGGYALGKTASPPPIGFSPGEAVAVAVALSRLSDRPFAADARGALRKLVAALPAPGDEHASLPHPPGGEHATRAHLPGGDAEARPAAGRVIDEALQRRRVLHITYEDRSGALTERDVEPGVFIGGRGGFWYLVAWCRLREDVRVFRLDRIRTAALTGEPATTRRQLDEYDPDIPDLIARDPDLD